MMPLADSGPALALSTVQRGFAARARARRVCGGVGGDVFDADFQDEFHGGIESDDAEGLWSRPRIAGRSSERRSAPGRRKLGCGRLPAVNAGLQLFLRFLAHIHETGGAGASSHLWASAARNQYVQQSLENAPRVWDGIDAKKKCRLAQEFADGGDVEPRAADEVAGGERDIGRVLFGSLAMSRWRGWRPSSADVDEADLHALPASASRDKLGGIIIKKMRMLSCLRN